MLKTLNSLYKSRIAKNGQNAYAESGDIGSTVRETHPELADDEAAVRMHYPVQQAKGKVVAVDFHGTLANHGDQSPIQPVIDKLKEMKNAGFHIIVYTSGITRNPGILNGLNVWLKDNQVPYDEIWQRQGKPDADIYIDDKAFNPTKEDIGDLEV
jgi:hypothetical protein